MLLSEQISLVYFGTLAQRHIESRITIQTFLKRISRDIPIFLDLNLRSPFYDKNTLAQSLLFCNFLKANDEEIFKLNEFFNWALDEDIPTITKFLMAEYNIEMVCVTKGAEGSELYREESEDPLVQKSVHLNHFQNSVGAGDAFSAMFAFGLAQQWSDKVLLERASSFASRICTIAGAIPDNQDFYTY
jgi:fructokinase